MGLSLIVRWWISRLTLLLAWRDRDIPRAFDTKQEGIIEINPGERRLEIRGDGEVEFEGEQTPGFVSMGIS